MVLKELPQVHDIQLSRKARFLMECTIDALRALQRREVEVRGSRRGPVLGDVFHAELRGRSVQPTRKGELHSVSESA